MLKQSTKQATIPPLAIHMVLSAVSGFVITFAFLLLSAWLFTSAHLPAWSAVPLSSVGVGLGCFMSGHILARRLKQNGLFCGLCCGVFFFLIYLAAALLNGQFEYTAMAAVKLVCYVLFGCIGGFTGILACERSARRPKH